MLLAHIYIYTFEFVTDDEHLFSSNKEQLRLMKLLGQEQSVGEMGFQDLHFVYM